MQASISITDLYDLLSEKIGKEQAKGLVAFVENKVEETINDKTNVLSTKEDINALNIKIKDIETKIVDSKADLLKWIIVLFMPFYIGMILFLIKFFMK